MVLDQLRTVEKGLENPVRKKGYSVNVPKNQDGI